MADYTYKPSINIDSLVSGLKNLKAEAVSAEKVMGMIGNRGNLNKLLETFLRMDDLVAGLTRDSDKLRESFGKQLRGGYLDNLDKEFGNLSKLINDTRGLSENILNVDLRKSNASTQIRDIATQINTMMAGLGLASKIDFDIFDAKSLGEQRDELIGYINQIGSQITLSIGKIDSSQVDGIGDEIAEGFDDATKNVKNKGKKFSEETQKQIDEINQQIDRLKKLKTQISKKADLVADVKKNGPVAISDDYGIEITTDNIIKLFDEIDMLSQKISSGKLSAEEYANSLLQLADATMKVQKASDTVKNDNALMETFKATENGARKGKKNLYDTLKFYSGMSADQYNKVIKANQQDFIQQAIADNKETVRALKSIDGLVSAKDLEQYTDPVERSLREIDLWAQKLNNVELSPKAYDLLEDKLDSLKEKFKETFNIQEEALNKLEANKKMTLTDLGLDEETTQQVIANMKGIISDGTQGPAAAIDQAGQKAISATEYINNMANALRRMFDVGSQKSEVEYKILVNGQEIDMRAGANKSVPLNTVVDSYLANLNSNTLVNAHSHQGLSANINSDDFSNAVKTYKSGLAPLSAMVGDNYITTIDLTKVKLEDLAVAVEKVDAAVAKSKTRSISAKKFNSILAEINPDYANVAKTWDTSQFNELAQYISNVGENAGKSLTPLEKFKALLSTFKNGTIDLSKYEDLFENFSEDNAAEIFNKIAKRENIIDEDGSLVQASKIAKSSVEDAKRNLEEQKNKYKELREEANLTYSDINDGIKKIFSDNDSSFLDKFYHPADVDQLRDYIVDVEDGLMTVDQLAARMAADFGIDPSEFQKTSATIGEMGTEAQDASNKVEEFNKLCSDISSAWTRDDMSNFDVGINTEKLETAKKELDALGEQGKITADELEQVNEAFNKAKTELGEIKTRNEDRGYDKEGFGDGKEKKLYETPSGQMSLFENMAEDAQKANDSASKLEDTVKNIENLDGQINLFDDTMSVSNVEQNISEVQQLESHLKSLGNEFQQSSQFSNIWDNLANEVQSGAKTAEQAIKELDSAFSAFNAEKNMAKIEQTTKAQKDKVNKLFKSLDFDLTTPDLTSEQKSIADKYQDIITQIKALKKNSANATSAQVNDINTVIAALEKEINAYKVQNNITDQTAKKSTKSMANYGKSYVYAATSRYNALSQSAIPYVQSGSTLAEDALNKYTAALNNLINAQKKFSAIQDSNSAEASQAIVEFGELKIKYNDCARALSNLIKQSESFQSKNKNIEKLNGAYDLDDEAGRGNALKDYVQNVYGADAAIGEFDDSVKKLSFTLKNADGTVSQMSASFDTSMSMIGSTTQKVEKSTNVLTSVFGELKKKGKELLQYTAARIGIDEVIQQVRNGIQYVREIDTALTELKKVTNETDATYNQFLQTASKTAGVIGSTVSELTTMSAEWARLGYSIEDSAKLAESTAILLNVSEFTDATQASEALISTMQAFQYTADDSQHVVDILNEVGNNFAVSSDGLATALQDSASALMEGGNNLEQSVALIAAANKVVQDPNQVGNALRTISLRLRGTSLEVMQELGEETDGIVEGISKMQAKIKAASGVNILTETGDYKDTYTILKEIGQVWEDMSDVDQAALLELMAGKNRSNVLAALLGNMDDLSGAYESALNAEGSAMQENEAYLDSVQGKIDQFNNSLQTMWMNALNSDMLKFFIDLGRVIVEATDNVGLLNAAMAGIFTFSAFKSNSLGDFITFQDGWFKLGGSGQSVKNFGASIVNGLSDFSFKDLGSKIKNAFVKDVGDAADEMADILGSSFSNVTDDMQMDDFINFTSGAVDGMDDLSDAQKRQSASSKAAGAANEANANKTKLVGVAAKAASAGVKLLNAVLTFGIGLLVSFAIEKTIGWIDDLIHKQENLRESAKEVLDTYSDAKENANKSKDLINSVGSEYETLAKGVDAFGNNISLTSDQYERYHEICNQIASQFPTMVSGYDAEGNAILKNKGNVEALTAAYEEQAQAARQAAIAGADDVFNAFKGDYDNSAQWFWEKDTGLKQQVELAERLVNLIGNENIGGLNSFFDVPIGASYSETDLKNMLNSVGIDKGDVWDASTGVDLEALQKAMPKLQSYLKTSVATINAETSKVKTLMDAYLGEDLDYAKLDNKAQSAVDTIISSLDADTLNRFDSADALYAWIDANILSPFTDPNTSAAITEAYQNLLEPDMSGLNWAEYQKTIAKNREDLWNAFGGDNNTLGENGTKMSEDDFFKMMGIEIPDTSVYEGKVKQALQDFKGMTEEQATNYINNLDPITVQRLFEVEWENVSEENIDDVLNPIIEKGPTEIKTYSVLATDLETYNEALSNTAELTVEGMQASDDYVTSLSSIGLTAEQVGKCIDTENGNIVTNVDLLNQYVQNAKKGVLENTRLAKSQSQLKYYELYKQMHELTNGTNQLTDAQREQVNAIYDQMNALEQTITKYSMLEQEILGATNAYTQFEQAQAADSATDYISNTENMLSALLDGFETGMVGTETFKAAIAGMVPESVYKDLDTVEAKMQAIYNYAKQDLGRYFTIDSDGNIDSTWDNMTNLIKDGRALGVFTGKDNNHIELSKDITSLKQFAEAFNITEEAAYALLVNMEKMDGEWINGDNQSFLDQLDPNKLSTSIYETTSAMADLEHAMANGEVSVDEYNAKYQELSKTQSDNAKKAQESAAAWIDANNNYQTAYDKVKSLNDEIAQMKEDGASEAEIQVKTDELAAATTELQQAVDVKSQLIEPSEVVIQLALDSINGQIEQWKADNAELELKVTPKLIQDENGEWTIPAEVKANLSEEEKKKVEDYLTLLNQKKQIEGSTTTEQENTNDQLKETKSLLEEVKDTLDGMPDLNINTKDSLESLKELAAILKKISDGDYDVEAEIDAAINKSEKRNKEAEKANDTLKETGATDYTFNIESNNIDDIISQIQEAQKALNHFVNSDGTINIEAEGCEEAQVMLATLISRKQALETPAILQVDTSTSETDVQNVINLINEFKTNYNTLEIQTAVGGDTTQAQADLNTTIAALQQSSPEILAKLGVDPTAAAADINTAINGITPTLMVQAGVDATKVQEFQNEKHDTTGECTWENNAKKVEDWMAKTLVKTGTVKWKSAPYTAPTFTANGTINWGDVVVNGTAHSSGTAHASGDWGIPRAEKNALVGELGQELVVDPNTGRYYTVGDYGAEFVNLPKDAIIFNHIQTRALLENGYVTGRGKAFVTGNAHLTRIPPGSGGGSGSSSSSSKSSSKSNSTAKKNTEATEDAAEQVVDFIEFKLTEIEQIISKSTAKIETLVGDGTKRKEKDDLYDKLVQAESNKAETYLAAAEKYNERANAALEKVPEQYREWAKNGAIEIVDFVGDTEQEYAEAIQEYRDWADKADDAEIGYLEAIAQMTAYRIEQLDDIAEEYNNLIDIISSKSDVLNSAKDLMEEMGMRASETWYKQLIANEEAIIKKKQEELETLINQLAEDVAKGDIKVGDPDYLKKISEFEQLQAEIYDSKTAVEEFNNEIQNIKWDNLDKLIDRFDNLDSELSFLYDNFTRLDDVVDDNGAWTDKGIAAIGVAAQQMEVAQTKIQQYSKALKDLYKSRDQYSPDEFIEKEAELKKGVMDSVGAYNDAQDAIIDLNKTRIDAVKDGIEKEIDAYKELIDKKKEALDADKDLYDFEKSVNEQQKEIATINRKLAALNGNTSLSAMSQRRKLEAEKAKAEADLEETYYERSLEMTKNALEKNGEEYEKSQNDKMDALDESLKDTEALVSDSLETVKSKADTVLAEIDALGQQYGITISDSIVKPWKDGENAISSYQEKLKGLKDSFAEQLQAIIDEEKKMQEIADKKAQEELSSIEQADINKQVIDKSNALIEQNKKPPQEPSNTNTNQNIKDAPVKGDKVVIDSDAQYYGGNSSNIKIPNWVKGNQYTVQQVGYGGKQVLLKEIYSWVKISDLKGYAKGTIGAKENQLAWVDELGEELQLVPGKNGRLEYIKKGTGIIPADLTEKLMNLALDPTQALENNRPKINISHVTNNEIHVDASIAEVVHIDTVTNDTLPNLAKTVEKQMDKYMKNINSQIRKYVR
jgi:TP901 family phage tail tape measure protein